MAKNNNLLMGGFGLAAAVALAFAFWPKPAAASSSQTSQNSTDAADAITANAALPKTYQVDYVCPRSQNGQIIDEKLMEIRIHGYDYPAEVPVGSQVVLTGSGGDDGTFDVFQYIIFHEGSGDPANKLAGSIVVQHTTTAPVTARITPGATVII